jgi:hypothetical protein
MIARSLGALLLLLLLLGSCALNVAFGGAIRLPNNYALASDYSGSYYMIDSYDGVATENSDGGILLAVVGDVVVGNVDGRNAPALSRRYFVFDTGNGWVREGLSEAAYRSALREVGIGEPPQLRRVTGLTRFGLLGRFRQALLTALWVAAAASVPALPVYYVVRWARRRPPSSGLWRFAWALPGLLFVVANLATLVI